MYIWPGPSGINKLSREYKINIVIVAIIIIHLIMYIFFYLGAHLNPAITVAVAILGKMKWKKVPIYCLAQYLACFVASACVYGIYYGKKL